MTPAEVSGIAQALPLLSTAKSDSSAQVERGAVAQTSGDVLAKDTAPVYVDTVSISNQSRQAIIDVTKEEVLKDVTKKEEVKKEAANILNNGDNSGKTAAKVQFVYDLKGDLITRYMDSSSRLIYQVPSELMLRLEEAFSKSNSSVDTKA